MQQIMNIKAEKIANNFYRNVSQILKNELIKGYLFGSYARGSETEESDLDILLIVNNYNWRIADKIADLTSEYSLKDDILISAIINDIKLWNKNKKHNTLFYKNIMSEGIPL